MIWQQIIIIYIKCINICIKLKDIFFSLLMSLKKKVSGCVAVPEDTTVITSHTNTCEMASTLNLGTDKGLSTAAKVSAWA